MKNFAVAAARPALARRRLIGATLAGLTLQAAGASAQGRGGVTRVVVPYAPGGTNDVTARILAPLVGERLGQPWVIENRSGANGAIGAAAVARTAPDGTTLLYANDVLAALKFVQRGVSFDIVTDFSPVVRAMTLDFVLVGSPRVVRQPDFAALAEAIRRRPEDFPFASSTLGAVGQLAPAALAQQLGVQATIIGYRGSGPALNDLVAGNVALGVLPVGLVMPMLREGQLKAFATTSARRLRLVPDVPTIAESGFPSMVFVGWNAIWGPANLPAQTVSELHRAITDTLRVPAVHDRLVELGTTPLFESPAEFAEALRQETERARAIVEVAGIQPE